MSDHSDRMEEAIRQALASRAGSLLSIASGIYPSMKSNGYLKVCPFCNDKGQTFGVKMAAGGHWYWGCRKNSCNANIDKLKSDRMADTIGFLMFHEGIDRKAAVDRLLSIAGIRNPREQWQDEQRNRDRKQKTTPPPPPAEPQSKDEDDLDIPRREAAEGSSSDLTEPVVEEGAPAEEPETKPEAPPEKDGKPAAKKKGRKKKEVEGGKPENVVPFSLLEDDDEPPTEQQEPTVWHEIWSRLTLSATDRESLKRKRGYSRETIEALGFRSSSRDNRTLLQPILDSFPIDQLLAEGIATKDEKTGEFKINSQLCGWGLKKRGGKAENDEWDWTNPILIPYFNRHGIVTTIRPHKGGLSGKRWMIEHGYEYGFRSTRTRTHPYVTPLLWNRPEAWQDKCVLTEGEFKAGALFQTAIPAVATPGIQMLKNDLFLRELVEILRGAGIKEVVVVYDNEDKSHKPDPWSRYEAEVYARYACHALRGEGFYTSYANLPDEWRIDGKADWDGALAKFGSGAKSKFHAVLKTAKKYYGQGELFSTHERERVIHCKLNRLTHVPTILTGGDEEEELAHLILKTPREWRALFQVKQMAAELRETRGCYYVRKGLDQKAAKFFIDRRKEIKQQLESSPQSDLKLIAGLEAALAAVNHILQGRPEILSDFTISCDYQLKTTSGEVRKLFRFRNKHGQVSDHVAVPSSASSTSTKFREFAMGIGNFNPMIGDKPLQQLMIELGKFSAWREIRELEMIGEDPESKLWIFGDCAFAPDGSVLFADGHDIIWHDGIGYRIEPADLRNFAHESPPKFFQKLGMEPVEVLKEIQENPEKEELEVAKIFLQLSADMVATFGDAAGILAIGTMLGYGMAPELLRKYNGQPGLWIHGRAFAGKTETTRFFMQMWGFDPGYRTSMLSGGTTHVAIDRVLAQYSNVPLHLDEFRQDEADKNRISSLRAPFNRQSKQKGKLDQSNKTRAVQPMTSPIVTGEGVTNDSATLSRYVEVILAADKRLGNKAQQRERYQRMLRQASGYHRIIRWVLMNRKWFAKQGIEGLDSFLDDAEVTAAISSDRMRLSYGSAFTAFRCLFERFFLVIEEAHKQGSLGEFMSREDLLLLQDHAINLKPFTLSYARNAAADVASINFVVKFWRDVMTAYARGGDVKKFIWFNWCTIDTATNQVTVTNAKRDGDGLIRCVLAQASPLYASYEEDCRHRGHTPELSLNNIRAESQTERYWVPGPTNRKNRSHRYSTEHQGQVNVWVLRVDRMDPALASVFNERFDANDDGEEELSF